MALIRMTVTHRLKPHHAILIWAYILATRHGLQRGETPSGLPDAEYLLTTQYIFHFTTTYIYILRKILFFLLIFNIL